MDGNVAVTLGGLAPVLTTKAEPLDIPASVERLAVAAFEAGQDRAAQTLFAVANLLRATYPN